MARVPEGLARELIEWAADVDNAVTVVGKTVVCVFCNYRTAWHEDDCLHTRSAEWLAAEKAAREWRPGETHPALKAKAVNRD